MITSGFPHAPSLLADRAGRDMNTMDYGYSSHTMRALLVCLRE